MAQQEKRKYKDHEDSQHDSNSQSQQQIQEEESEDDSFIADDDEEIEGDPFYRPRLDDEEEEEDDRKKTKRQKKKEKRRLRKMRQEESELDEDDLDVLQQVELQGGRLNRLKKKTEIARKKYSDEDQEEEEEIDDFEERDLEQRSQSVGGYRQESSEESGLNEAFQEQGGDIFQPQDQKRFFQQQQDKQIIAIDIPQRYYYQLRNYAKSHNKSIEETIKLFEQEDRNAEVKWIYTKGKFFHHGEQRLVKQKIRLVLGMLHRQKIEIMYIYYYRRKVYGDLLSRDDLWKIYKLDLDWFVFKEQFTHLRDNLMNVIYSFQEMPQLQKMIHKTVDIQELKYFKQFQNFKLLDNKVGRKKNIKHEIISQVRGKGLDEWLRKSEAFLSPQNLCHNLIERRHEKKAKNPLYEPREELERVLRSNNPQNDKILFPLLVPQKRIQTICHYLQLQLFSHPQLRKYLKQQYYGSLIISTTPTKKGSQDINIYSQYFPVKSIKDKLVKTLPRQIWILAQQAQKRELINIELRFKWQKSGIEQRQFDLDEVFKKIIHEYYQASLHKEGQLWNIFRRSVIVKMLTDYFFPAFFKEIKDELTKEGEQVIINAACQVFRKKLLIPPQKNKKLAIVLEDKKLGIAFVDQDGIAHSPLEITLVNDDELKRFANDEIIRKYIEDFSPDFIRIGANSRKAQTLRKAIRQKIDRPLCDFCQYEIPSLVAKQKRLEGSTQQLTVLEAVSMARYEKNPLLETLTLWSDNIQQNGILSMNLHPSQSFVDQRKLKDALELVAVQAVNLVGVDINQLIKLKQDTCRKVLQFVCGLGPRKAFDFSEKLLNQEIINRNQIRGLVTGDLVFKNCAPFFKVETPSHRVFLKAEKDKKKERNERINLLDTTRIPPEWYETTDELVLKAIKNFSLDMRQRKIYTNCEQKTIALLEMFKDPSKVNSIQWILKRQESSFYDEKLVKEEFMNRFKMPNTERYHFNLQELFYSLLRETRDTLKKYMIVTVKILSVNEKSLNVVIPENGLFGWIKIYDKKPEYQKGNFIKAIISSFPFQQSSEDRHRQDDKQQELLKVEMVLSFPHKTDEKIYEHNCFENCFKSIVKELHPMIDLENFDLKKEDRPIIEVREDTSTRPMKTEFRKISHRKFKNLAVGPAIELIKNAAMGDFIIRPSSDGLQYLNITWHFCSGIISHIKLKSQQRNISTSAPVYRIISEKDNKVYESLDKVIDEFITPMNSLVADVTSNRKFIAEPIEKIEEKAKIEMNKDPSLIHYYFGCSPEYPQFFLLIYMYREKKPIKELIKVRSTGLYFHDQVFSNLRELIAWFKSHCKEKDYQSFVKKFSLRK